MKEIQLLKIQDVRVGNLVGMDALNVYLPNFISGIRPLKLSEITKDWFEPIPRFCGLELTEIWLERFGFKKGINNSSITIYSKGRLYIIFKDKKLSKAIYGHEAKVIDDTPEYVHLLQNLWFALYGYELILDEKP